MKKIKLFLIVFFLAACGSDSFRGTELPDMPFHNIELTDQYGQKYSLKEQRGKIIFLFFGFTFCPDVCPLTLSTWKRVENLLTSEQLQKTEFVYITVDPMRDTAEKLKSHLAVFSNKFIGLTGSEEQLEEVYRNYGVYREKVNIAESATGYLMNHTAFIYILNKKGIWQLKHSNDALPQDIVHDFKILLSQKAED